MSPPVATTHVRVSHLGLAPRRKLIGETNGKLEDRHRIGGVTVTPETGRWDALAAARTRGDVGEGIASVLALLGLPDLISFAGGFPDPATFPRERMSALLQEFAAAGEVSAFQYAPTRGLAGPLDALADRLETAAGPPSRRRRAADHERCDRGARARLQVVPRSRAIWSSSKARPISARSRRFEASRRSSSPFRWTSTGSRSTSSSGGSGLGCARSSSTAFPTTRTRQASASRPSAGRRSSSSRAATGS